MQKDVLDTRESGRSYSQGRLASVWMGMVQSEMSDTQSCYDDLFRCVRDERVDKE